jgi:8-oxo-dGTP pyrophosphatase MutT (NUDIX family)
MNEVSVPNKASTIIVVRPGATIGFEVLMTRRAEEMQFLAGFLVFPGGAVETKDWSESMLSRCRGLTRLEAHKILGRDIAPDISLGHWVAAVRELFEETGIHFFINEDGETADRSRGGPLHNLEEKRRSLSQRALDLPQLLESERLFCDLGRLTYLFHRITPAKYRVRFDTRFYLAALPENQSALNSSEEVSESLWLTPKVALAEAESGKLSMMPPTLIALRSLAQYGSWENLCAAFHLR